MELKISQTLMVDKHFRLSLQKNGQKRRKLLDVLLDRTAPYLTCNICAISV